MKTKNNKKHTLINVTFRPDMMDHRLEIKTAPIYCEDENETGDWLGFFQHAFDTRRRSGMIPLEERRRIHFIAMLLAAVTAEPEDDTVEDTLGYADLLLVARAKSLTEEEFIKRIDRMYLDMDRTKNGESSEEQDETELEEFLDNTITRLNRTFDEKMVKAIADKLTIEDQNPDFYKYRKDGD